MISDARGKHVSPGIYFDERDVVYTPKSLGSTSLGLVGETLYGPAFQNVEIQDWGEFLDYFGGTSTEKMIVGEDGIDTAPKYQLPYIAKNYLKESKKLNVVRVLGLSGYKAGKRFDIYEDTISGTTSLSANGKTALISSAKTGSNLLASIRSYAEIEDNEACSSDETKVVDVVSAITIGEYTAKSFEYGCNSETTATGDIKYPNKFSINVTYTESGKSGSQYFVSLNPNDGDYIGKVLTKETGLYVEGVYGLQTEATSDVVTPASETTAGLISGISSTFSFSANTTDNNFEEAYRPAVTPWFVSEAKAKYTKSGNEDVITEVSMQKLFKFVTISDGAAANFMIKISIQNINPITGTFDVVVRDYNDSDASPVILERFRGCTMNLGETSYIGFKIGTLDGRFIAKSKYITVVVDEDVDLSGNVPCGFLGYPINYSGFTKPEISYDYEYTNDIANNKNHYFGINTKKNFFEDILSYKGVKVYDNESYDADPTKLNNGFHMDSALGKITTATKVLVDGVSGYGFTAVESKINGQKEPRLIKDDGYLKSTIYKDMNNRKFTVCFYGGFDGWDINRKQRTNTDKFKSSSYVPAGENQVGYKIYNQAAIDGFLNLPKDANTSDYYAYLAGYNVFSNPEDIKINLIATPGIDWFHNRKLTQEVINLIEDSDLRRGDALYVMDSPNGFGIEDIAEAFEAADINSSYVCTYYPWILYKDSTNSQYIELSPTKDVVRNMAAVDKNYYTWFSPAGVKRGDVDCEKAVIKTTLSDEDTLYGNMINPIKTFARDGVKIWGNKTAYPVESPLNRINVRRLMIWLKETIGDAAKELIFDPYDETLEEQFRDIVEPKLKDVKSKRGIYDYILQVENTPETRDEHILPAKILIKPTPTLEYISLSFVIYPESVDFNEG